MSIIIENQNVKAGVQLSAGGLEIAFPEDPAFVLSESVIVDLLHRSIGIIYQNTYHHIGPLPQDMAGKDIEAATNASLTGLGGGGREISLHAPIKIIRN